MRVLSSMVLTSSHNHPSAERRLRLSWRVGFWRQTPHNHPSAERRLRQDDPPLSPPPPELTTILQPKGGCDTASSNPYPLDVTHNHPSAERRLRLELLRFGTSNFDLTTILQPKGGCDVLPFRLSARHATHNHPSAERRLRPPSSLAVGGAGNSQPSFSRKAVATRSRGSRRRCRRLTTILQPKGGCDSKKSKAVWWHPSHNHPSAERRLRLHQGGEFNLHQSHNHPSAERRLRHVEDGVFVKAIGSQPSFSRKAVATDSERELGSTPLTHNHPSAERRLRLGKGDETLVVNHSQPSFSRKAVATRRG